MYSLQSDIEAVKRLKPLHGVFHDNQRCDGKILVDVEPCLAQQPAFSTWLKKALLLPATSI